ncbi:MAG TPA: radical SAM protein [Spirochaetota bacterium]|nr:radical SAM protein [Spirochaetota bacterium]HPC39684.1 radical SAM protein [Spirochaetota bacterium]HPL17223.1 radical SAM protein [Spirochaetota bacterium]HQF07412.1 radical SAM protein [Spirochaetota bacterium]HQH96672.1 radical SAM protein [Spirochaetota bacterium]
MPKLVLIQPRFGHSEVDRNIKTVYPLGLGYLASHVPPRWDVEIIDEQLEKIDFNLKADMVGLTTTILTANRAYEIAGEFRKRGVTVIIGGVHASMLPDEAIRFCDAVCIGDGEQAIVRILEDFEKGKLKKKYTGELGPLTGLKPPRRDIFKKGYTFMPVNTSRGCPFSCHFCVINEFYQGKYRKREVEDVIRELRELPGKGYVIFFTDGNMVGYSANDVKRFKELCRRIIEEKKAGRFRARAFMGYASVNALDDDELLDLASQAGCSALFVGFESINPASLKDMNKALNLKYGPESYGRLIDKAHRRKIAVVGEFIVGNDSDDAAVLEETRKFLAGSNLDILRLQLLQPLPGTKLYANLEKEGRLFLKNFPEDWKKAEKDFIMGVNFQLKNLNARELRTWAVETGLEFYNFKNILKRAWRFFKDTGDLKWAVIIMVLNYKSRKSYANVTIE